MKEIAKRTVHTLLELTTVNLQKKFCCNFTVVTVI